MLKPMKGKLGYILRIIKKMTPQIRNLKKKSKIQYISTIIAPLGMPLVSKEAV
jgi:hypothetical protein